MVLLESIQKVIDRIDNLAMLDGEQLQRIFELYNEVVTYALQRGKICSNKGKEHLQCKLDHFKSKQKLCLLRLEQQLTSYIEGQKRPLKGHSGNVLYHRAEN